MSEITSAMVATAVAAALTMAVERDDCPVVVKGDIILDDVSHVDGTKALGLLLSNGQFFSITVERVHG